MEKPMRILQVFGELNHGGAESMVMSLYRKVDRNKIQFDFVVHGFREGKFEAEIKEMGGKIYRVPKYNLFNHVQYKKTWKNILQNESKNNNNIIHSHVRSTANIILKMAKKYNYITIAHSHSTSNGTGIKSLVKKIFQRNINKYSDYFFAPTFKAGEWLFGKKINQSENFAIINNAIETEKFIYNKIIRRRIKKELKLNQGVVIGHVGSFREVKNHSFLIDVFYEFKKENIDAKLLLIGDGELISQIVKKIDSLNLKQDVLLLGTRSNVNELLQAMDILVFPSYYEGLPVSIIEAQASGLPCILSDTITREVAITDIVKFLSLKQSTKIWSDEISKTINNHIRKNMGNEIIESGYDAEEVSNKLVRFYLSL